jgi:hypothetical protein
LSIFENRWGFLGAFFVDFFHETEKNILGFIEKRGNEKPCKTVKNTRKHEFMVRIFGPF